MRIGEMADEAGVNIQTLRYYERRGLIVPSRQSGSGYREYNERAVSRVRFIRRAQDLGFTLQEIAGLLAFQANAVRSCTAVEGQATAALDRIDGKIADLRRMRRALSKYVRACHERRSLDSCPLLSALGGEGTSRVD